MAENRKELTVIGIMSGTSLDGLDIACCNFDVAGDNDWKYKIVCAETIPYNETWKVRLSQLHHQPMHLYVKTDAYYGKYIGQQVNGFIKRNNITNAQLIASHGHTIFHNPAEGYTAQIGSGAAIYAETGLPVVCDFRTVDVAMGGQGAPLVPMADREIMKTYDCNASLNLGGFANITFNAGSYFSACDTGPCNIILNRVAAMVGQEYDQDGEIASQGNIHQPLLDALNALAFFELPAPKSLGREWVEQTYWPVIQQYELSVADLMATLCEQVAVQINKQVNMLNAQCRMLITGGGAFNQYLINRIVKNGNIEVVVPDDITIQYKEALIFAYLGLLRAQGQNNVLKQVTGARANNMGGALFGHYTPNIIRD